MKVLLLSQSLDNSTDANTSAAPGNNTTTVIFAVDESVAGVINSEHMYHPIIISKINNINANRNIWT